MFSKIRENNEANEIIEIKQEKKLRKKNSSQKS